MLAKNQLEKILTEYVTENKEKFYRMAFQYVKNEEQALDIVQDAIIKALTNLHKLKNEEYIKTWFYRILINECLQAIKKNKKENVFNIDEYNISTKDENIVEMIDLYTAIDKLNPKLRTVIVLRFFESMSLEEISKITKVNINTTKSRLYKAIKELKILIRKEN